MGALIRDAIDQSLSDERRGARAAAGASFLSAPDMPLPDWPALEQEIEQAAADDTDPALA